MAETGATPAKSAQGSQPKPGARTAAARQDGRLHPAQAGPAAIGTAQGVCIACNGTGAFIRGGRAQGDACRWEMERGHRAANKGARGSVGTLTHGGGAEHNQG